MESILKTINVSAISPVVLERKTFGKTLFIIDATPVDASDVLVKYSSYAEVVDAFGSATEAERFAKAYFLNGAYGTTPPFMWVLKVDITGAGEDLGDVLTTALQSAEDFYYVSCDENFTIAQKQEIAETVELFKDNWFMCMFEYTDIDAYDLSITTDISSVLGALNYQNTVCNYSQKPLGNNQYLTGAVCGEMSGVEYTQTRGKYQPAKKELSGILVNGLSDSDLTKLHTKNYNYYTATTTIKDNNWYGLNSRNVSGDSFIDIVAMHYMSYELTVTLAELLHNESIIGFDRDGFGKVESTLDSKMQAFLDADILAVGGVASDGELFPFGYKIVMPSLASITPTDKMNGDLKGIVVRILPKYSITAFDIVLSAQI